MNRHANGLSLDGAAHVQSIPRELESRSRKDRRGAIVPARKDQLCFLFLVIIWFIKELELCFCGTNLNYSNFDNSSAIRQKLVVFAKARYFQWYSYMMVENVFLSFLIKFQQFNL